MASWFTPLRLASLCAALDLAWGLQAMACVPRHAGSNVAMVSLVVWVVLHLPAAALAGLALYLGGPQAPGAALPTWSLVLLGALGVGETFALVLGLGLWRSRVRARPR